MNATRRYSATSNGIWILAVGITAALLAGSASAGSLSRLNGAAAKSVATSPAPTQLQIVLDTSASVPAQHRHGALREIADTVAIWPQPLAAAGKSDPQPGLVVQARGIGANSYAPESVLGTWIISGIPGVAALPNEVTPDFTERVIAFKRERAAAEVAYRRSHRAARRVARALRGLRPMTTHVSEIHGGVSAAAQSFSPRGNRKLVVVSDLEQNREPQIAGSLKGVHVLVAHICRRATRCLSQERVWGRHLRGRGAVSVAFVRIERFGVEIEAFLRSP